MKSICFSFWAAVLVMVAVFTGCQKNGNYYDAIPADASFVMGINVKNIIDKGDLKNILSEQSGQLVLPNVFPAAAEKMKQVFINPENSGLDLNEKIFLFVQMKGENMGMVAKVNDEAKVTELFELLNKDGKCGPIEKESGYKLVKMDDKLFVAYNKQTLLAFDEGDQKIAALLVQKPEQSIAVKEEFKKMLTVKGDMCYWLAMGDMYGKLVTAQQAAMMPAGIDLTKMNVLGGISFENGKMELSAEYFTTDPGLQELFKKQSAMYQKMNNMFMPFFPASTLFYMSSNVNGAKVYEMMAEYKMFDKLQVPPQVCDLQKLISSFNGDFTLGLTGVSDMGMPSMALYAEVSNDYLMQMLAGLKNMSGMYAEFLAKGTNTYEVKIPMLNMTVWFGMHDKYFFMTNSADTYSKIGEKVQDPLNNNKDIAVLKDSYGGYFVNIAAVMQLPVAGMLFNTSPASMAAYQVLSATDGIAIYVGEAQKLDCIVYAKDRNQNILKTWVEMGQKLAK